MSITDSFDSRGRMIKFFSTADEARQFATSINTTKYKILDYGTLDNFKHYPYFKCYPYYVLYEEKMRALMKIVDFELNG